MTSNKDPQSIDEYIGQAPEEAQALLSKIRETAHAAVADCEECISYKMPALRKNGRVFFYFAAFRSHVGIYPPLKHDAELISKLEPFRGPKGNLKFPYSSKMSMPLLRRIVKALAKEYAPEKVRKKKSA